MKKIFTLLIGIVLSIAILNSQVAPPQAFSFKANIKDKYGLPVLFKKINLRMTILQGGMNGTVVYSEYFTPTTDLYSQVDVQIGRGTVLPGYGNFPSIDWSSDEYFLKIEVDTKGGTNYQMLSVTQLLSVPYALYAGTAGNAFSGNYSDLIGAPIFANVATTGNYNDLLNQPTLFSGDYNDLTSKPSLFSGNYNDLSNKPPLFDGTWSSLSGKPTFNDIALSGSWEDLNNTPVTLAGYGITDAMNILHPANIINEKSILNWNNAFGWGDHTGLYKPIAYVPIWSEITENPFLITSPLESQLLRFNSVAGKWENWQPDFLTVEVDGSITNEIQDLMLNADNLRITGNPHATEIDLSPYKADGSETKVIAGNNVTVNGAGTEADPYIITSSGGSAGLTLAQVIKFGNDADGKNIKNLATPVDNGDAVTKAYVDELLERIEDLELLVSSEGIQDFEGNIYSIDTIGELIWMTENLRSLKFDNGRNIRLINEEHMWDYDLDPKMNPEARVCYYNFETENRKVYGGLYNRYAVEHGGLCPTDWHVATRANWEYLIGFLGGLHEAGDKIKETGNLHWLGPNPHATNESGFTALPGGRIDPSFKDLGRAGYWWGIFIAGPGQNAFVTVSLNDLDRDVNIIPVPGYGSGGYSVRCVYDYPVPPKFQ